MRSCLAFGIMWVGAALPMASSAPPSIERIQAVGTEFRVILSDGRVLSAAQLIGAVLSIADGHGDQQAVRIDAIESDPTDPDREIQLHTLSVQDPTTGSWNSF